jgi:competence protein ComEA
MFRQSLFAFVIVSLLAAAPHRAAAQTVSRASAKASSTAVAAGVVNLNTASASDLEALPGIGAKTAARIIEYRQKNGPFKKIEELMNVRGVGEKNFLKLKPQISVAARAEGAAASK